MPGLLRRRKFPIMWILALLLFIGFNFYCASASDVGDTHQYRNGDILRTRGLIMKETSHDRNPPTAALLSNVELMGEHSDNKDSQPSKRSEAIEFLGKSFKYPTIEHDNLDDIPYMKMMRYPHYSSDNIDYDMPLHELNTSDLNDEDYPLVRSRRRRPPGTSGAPLPPQSIPHRSNSKQNNNNTNNNSNNSLNQMSENSELKSLLKMQQFSGFSLSEILQQKNLSLSDLLKGKTEVISALRASDGEEEEEEEAEGKMSEHNRISIVMTTPRIFNPSDDKDKKQNKSDDLVFKIVTTSANVSIESSTTASGENDEIMEFSDVRKQDKFHKDVNFILNSRDVLTTTECTSVISTGNEGDDANAGIKSENIVLQSVDAEYQNEQPSNTGNFIGNYDEKKLPDELSPVNHRVLEPKGRIYEEILSDIEPDARAEILELWNSSRTAERIEELLKARNMSLEELIALRQRGSSRLHLTQVKATKLESQRSELFAEGGASERATSTSQRENKQMTIDLTDKSDKFRASDDKIEKKPIQLGDLVSTFESFPFTVRTKLRTSRRNNNFVYLDYDNIDDDDNNNNNNNNTDDDSEFDDAVEIVTKIEENKRNYSATGNATSEGEVFDDYVTLSAQKNVKNEKINASLSEIWNTSDDQTLSRVRPTIITIGIMLGLIFLSFLLIFLMLRIRQKQKFTYEKTLPSTVFQVPVINSRKLSNFSRNTVMINVAVSSTLKKRDMKEINNDIYDYKSDIENDSLDANDSWNTIPEFVQ